MHDAFGWLGTAGKYIIWNPKLELIMAFRNYKSTIIPWRHGGEDGMYIQQEAQVPFASKRVKIIYAEVSLHFKKLLRKKYIHEF